MVELVIDAGGSVDLQRMLLDAESSERRRLAGPILESITEIDIMNWQGVALLAALMIVTPATADADIILEVSDNGTDLRLQWTGSMNVGTTGTAGTANLDAFQPGSGAVASRDGSVFAATGAGSISGNDPWIASATTNIPSNGTGTSFGFQGGRLFWDDTFGATPGVISPNRAWTFSGLTVATAFGANLDSGPVVLWTHGTTSETISVGLATAAVPEPSSLATLCLGTLGFVAYRRRR